MDAGPTALTLTTDGTGFKAIRTTTTSVRAAKAAATKHGTDGAFRVKSFKEASMSNEFQRCCLPNIYYIHFYSAVHAEES